MANLSAKQPKIKHIHVESHSKWRSVRCDLLERFKLSGVRHTGTGFPLTSAADTKESVEAMLTESLRQVSSKSSRTERSMWLSARGNEGRLDLSALISHGWSNWSNSKTADSLNKVTRNWRTSVPIGLHVNWAHNALRAWEWVRGRPVNSCKETFGPWPTSLFRYRTWDEPQ